MAKNISGFVWVFPPQSALAGQKCIVFHDFQNHKDFTSCLNQAFEVTIKINGQTTSEKARIMNFGKWFSTHHEIYGICLPTSIYHTCRITEQVSISLGAVL